jgi:hypothetical protein
MKIISEIDGLTNFEPWSGAVYVCNTLTYEQLQRLENELEQLYPEGMTDTQVNDILWHESDWVAELLGFRNWEHLERTNEGAYEPIKIQCHNIDWDTDDEEYEGVEVNLPESVLFELEDEDDIEEWYEHKENGDEDDFLSDKLSDEYDFCVNSFEYKED